MAQILNNKDFIRHYEEFISQSKAEGLFVDNTCPLTPNRLVRRALKKLGKRKSILVLYTLEFALELYVQGHKNVTIATKEFCSITKFFADKLGYKYYTLEEIKGMGRKFNAGVTNPPYKQGLFRDFMLDLLENLIEDDGVLAQVSPDETLPTNNKNHKTLPAMKKYGLQEIEDASVYFPNVTTSAPIVTYYFDKSKAYNPSVFDKELTEKDKLTLLIVEKIQEKQKYGTLTQSTIGELDNTSTEMVNALVKVTKSGPVYKLLPRNETRFISNSDDYMFTNMFIGLNKEDCVVKGNGSMYIAKTNIYAIGNTKIFNVDNFVEIYLHPTIRFYLKFLRGNNTRTLGLHIRQLPLIMPKTNINVYFNLTTEEIEHIENELG